MKRNVAIVGSGFAAWGAAVALVRQGDVSVTLFDIGLTQAGSDMANKPVHNAKKCDGSFYCYGVNDPDFPVQLNSLRICSSHAFGGHSNVYSGAVLYPKNHDLSDWPEASLPQAEDYAAVLSKIRILHQPDALDNFFPMPPDFLTISEKKTAETVSVAGMSRIALRQPDNQNEDLPARLFSAREEFKSMVSLGLLAYTGGCYVSHAISRDGRVELSYNINGLTGAATFDAVFLGAGCVNTTAIVDRSVHPPGSRDFSIRAPRLAIHAFFRIPWKDDPASRIRRQNGLPEYFLEVRSPLTGDAWSHTQLSCVNEQIIDSVCSLLPRLLHPVVRWSRGLLYFAMSLKASDGYEMARMRSVIAGDGALQSVSLTEHPAERLPQFVRVVRRAALSHWRLLRMVPIPFGEHLAEFFRGNRLGGWHFGGTLPMRTQPVGQTECWPSGEVKGLSGVYVLDSAAFPFIPASTVALLTMAHGHRVARCWKSRLFSKDQ